jgi:hypothetical protein
MTRPKVAHLLLASVFVVAPWLALAQPDLVNPDTVNQVVDTVRDAAAGTALFVIAIAAMALLFGTLREKFKRDLLARFVDKGQEIPAALLPRPPSRERELRRGVWLTSLGLGVGLALFLAGGPRVAAWCLILLLLGAASFLNAVLFYPNDSGEQR